ncbi:afadin isoform X4 [Condylostylus longicornis]|uniref:afadin isoform X4 n=1 Tax=Condylostylus longicornis TaxID=2530218 RepID=UPI00244DBC90|nr:afadin isoform X4 [Condylostylus longicornis]
MEMPIQDKKMLERKAVQTVIQQWNTNRIDLFALSEPDENLLFHGVMRFYFQDAGQKVATKCIRVASDATVSDVIETLVEKFRPDMRMLSVPNYALYEVHANGEERRLNPDEKPLLVQLNWHIDDREGRFLLRNIDQKTTTIESTDNNFKRKLSKREKKEQKKKEKLAKLNSESGSISGVGGGNNIGNGSNDANHVAEKLYTELPETSFTRSISNPEAVMRRRRQQKLEKKLQQFRSRDGGPDTGGTLKIYGESLCRDVPYKTLLLSIRDCAQAVVREMLTKYGLEKADPLHYCLVQVNSDGTEYILDDDECPLSILMNHPTSRGSIMFHVRRRPADSQPRRRKKKPLGVPNGTNNICEREGPMLVEVTHSGDGGRRIKLGSDPVEVGSANTNSLQLFGPSIQARHCLISLLEGVCTVTPLHTDALTFVNGHHITQPTILHNGSVVMFGRVSSYRFIDSPSDGRYNLALSQSQLDSACLYERNSKISMAEMQQGQEPILPAVLEFPETHQENFLRQVITELDVNAPNFKLSPVYTLYLCARYRASTHYRPELQPTERAHKLTIFLHHVANLIYSIIQDQYNDPRVLAFWMANSSEFLHFLKSDRHISAFSVQAQEVLAESVQSAFRNLVNCFRVELSQTLNQFLSENIDHESAAGFVLTVLGSAMALLRRCRVNAALTIQLFSQLFHYINVICFNTIVANSHMCTAEWGKVMLERLQLLELWAERQGLELAADCHLAKINQCAQFLQAPKTTVEEIQKLACSCFRLNSLQMAALLQQEQIPRNLIDTAIRMAESVADELTRADGREVRLEESPELHLALLLPDDGFSCDVVRGIPSGLVDFLNPLQAAGMCRLAAQPTSIGLWTVYMHQFNTRSPSSMSNKLPQPEVQVIKLHKNSNGMGLSIVAAKGAGQERLGIYIKSVVPGGAADADGRLQAGDQLLRVDGQSLIGITQERAADYLVRTGPIVTLEVAKQGAIYHGLATLLQQPSPVIQRGNRRMSERDINRVGDGKMPLGQQQMNQLLPNSKSVPALHHVGGGAMVNSKSRSIHNLVNNNNSEQGFYQNLSVYRAQNQSQPLLTDRHQISQPGGISSSINQQVLMNTHPQAPQPQPTSNIPSINSNTMTNPPQSILNRPTSAYYHATNSNATNNSMPSPNSIISYNMSASSTNLSNGVNSNLSPVQQGGQHSINRLKMNQQNFSNRDLQSQQQRINSMMAPSMPNIAAAHSVLSYPGQMSSSQSMQNVNMIPGSNSQPQSLLNNELPQHQHAFQNGPLHLVTSPQSGQHLDNLPIQYHHHTTNPTAAQIRGQGKMIEMAEHATRRLHGNDSLNVHVGMTGKLPMHSPQGQAQLPQMSPIKQLPPTAPKPQHLMRNQISYSQNQPETIHEELHSTPPLPPTTTHPLFKNTSSSTQNINYVASTLDPPKAAYYPVASALHQHHQKNYLSANPWEREEREKEHEMRREHIRQWRDHQISELSAITNRTPQQEEQLKTLVLERDFERRAQEDEDQEEENEVSYNKENVQEVIRLAHQNSTIQTPVTNFRQVDVKITSQTVSTGANNNSVTGNDGLSMTNSTAMTNANTSTTMTTLSDPQQSYPSFSTQQNQIVQTPTTVQPKSILKNNRHGVDSNSNTPGSPSKSQKSASFADDHKLITQTEMPSISQLTKDIINLDINNGNADQLPLDITRDTINALDNSGPPPPPPERNSSYLVMSQQQQKLKNPALIKNSINDVSASNPSSLINNNSTAGKQRPSLVNNNSTTINNNSNSINNANNNNNNSSSNNNIINQHIAVTTVTTHSMNNPHIPVTSSITQNILNMSRDNKRVSFHDEDNNFVLSQEYSSEQADLDIIREDPNRFIQETNALLQTPTTPEADMWNTTVQSTPGVIGAQEVYRDPRTRRLAEQQQKQQQKSNEAVPEKLSFKEKMKMFALESGENQTPKDKLKISRAQRDIDAVH